MGNPLHRGYFFEGQFQVDASSFQVGASDEKVDHPYSEDAKHYGF